MAAIIKQPTWVAYTPTITASSGTFTTVAGAGRYYKTGRVCHIQIQVTITTNGTGAGGVVATLPFTSAAVAQVLNGREVSLVGSALTATLFASATTTSIVGYNNTYVGGSGATLVIGGTYETAS